MKQKSSHIKGKKHQLVVSLKTAKKRKISSQKWLQRQLNDPYVSEAKQRGYRSRAAFKLLELNEKYHFLHKKSRVIDLGAAPGGWTQVVVETVAPQEEGQVIGIDLTPIEPFAGATFLEGDFLEEGLQDQLKDLLKGPVDVVLSDMAAPSTGHSQTDHLRIMALAEEAFHFAKQVLALNGTFIAKMLQGGAEKSLLEDLKKSFKKVVHSKPPASRSDSAEIYLVALEFKGP